MDRKAIIDGLRETLVSILGHESFDMREDLMATDVEGWDSLTHMRIITQVEKRFAVKFKLKEINKLKNMGSLIELVSSKVAS